MGIAVLDSKDKSADFVRRHGLTFPNGWDGNGRIARAYGFTYQPFWAVINRDGQLLRAGFGPNSEDELASTIRSVTRR